MSDGSSATSMHQQSSHEQPFRVDLTTRSSQLASISVKLRELWTLIANQPANDFDHYVECLDLVSRGLTAGKVKVMVEGLRNLLDEPTSVTGTSSQWPSITSAHGNKLCKFIHYNITFINFINISATACLSCQQK